MLVIKLNERFNGHLFPLMEFKIIMKVFNLSIYPFKPVTEEQIPHDSTYLRYLKLSVLEVDRTGVVARPGAGGGRRGELLISRYKVPIMQNDYILESYRTILCL